MKHIGSYLKILKYKRMNKKYLQYFKDFTLIDLFCILCQVTGGEINLTCIEFVFPGYLLHLAVGLPVV